MTSKNKHYCSVPQCKNYRSKYVTIHLFPSNIILREKWRVALRIGKKITKGMMVCSEHFLKEDFFPSSEYTKKKFLKKNVIPSQKIPKRPFDKPQQNISSARSCRAKARHRAKIYSEENLERHEEIMNMDTTVAAVEDTSEEKTASPYIIGLEQHGDVEQFVVLDYPDGITDPISLDLLQGFRPGFAITVVAKTCDVFKFEIKDCSANILLHVVTRFAQNCVILNSYFCGWGPEERTLNMPIRKDEKFSLICTYEVDGYRVFVDGAQIAFYKHRSSNPPEECEIEGAKIFKAIYGKGQPLWAVENTTLDFGPHGIPSYTTTLPQLVPGSWISMSGLVNDDCVYIGIDLVNEHKDILFHFNPRFNKGQVVRNSFLNDAWGVEETGGGMPLTKCKPFCITYVLETSCIRVYVNGLEFTTYNHRAIYAPKTTIRISGGIKLLKFLFFNNY